MNSADRVATYTLTLAVSTVLLALVTVWSAVRGDVERRHRADAQRLLKDQATRHAARGMVRALSVRLSSFVSEIASTRTPIADAGALTPLIAAILHVDVAASFGEHFGQLVEAVVAVQEAALSIQRLLERIAIVSQGVNLESSDERALLSWAHSKGSYPQTRPAPFDQIRPDFLRDAPFERTADEREQCRSAINDAVAKMNALESASWFTAPTRARTYGWVDRWLFFVVEA